MAKTAEGKQEAGEASNSIHNPMTQEQNGCKNSCMVLNGDGTFTLLSSEETLSGQQAMIYCKRCNLEDGFR